MVGNAADGALVAKIVKENSQNRSENDCILPAGAGKSAQGQILAARHGWRI